MARQKYNHNRRITGLQPAIIKSLYPGTIVQFKYSGDKIFDKKPVVLVLWNDYIEYKIHGINLNYLTEFEIKLLFKEIMERGNRLVVEDQDDDTDYDDQLPYRNLLKDIPIYYFLTCSTTGHQRHDRFNDDHSIEP